MRTAWVIVILVAVGAALAVIRTKQVAAQARTYQLEAERLQVRRRLWNQQLRLGRLRRPREVQVRFQDWALPLAPPGARPAGEHIVRRDR